MRRRSHDELLAEYVRLAVGMLVESPASDAFEQRVVQGINDTGEKVTAQWSQPTQLPDVLVMVKGLGETFVEAKMGHSDNLANPRVFYDGYEWRTTYKTEVAKYAVRLLNESDEAMQFVEELAEHAGIDGPKLPTTKGGLADPDAVPLEIMREFVDDRGSRYIATERDVNIGRLVTMHYTKGKSSPANYLQAGDDFYLIGSKDPFGLKGLNKKPPIPRLSGSGDFRVRVSTRSRFYEIQAEVKIKHFRPASSSYSVLPGSSKTNPFVALNKRKRRS